VTIPAETPVTTPEALTAAIAMLLLLHIPPGAASLSVIEEPSHTELPPVIVPETGIGFTIKFDVTRLVSPPATTV